MRAFLVVKSDIKENPAISRVYFIPRRSEPDSHTCSGQNGFAKLAKWFCIAFKV